VGARGGLGRHGTTILPVPVSAAEISRDIANFESPNPFGFTEYPYTVPVGCYVGIASPIGCENMGGNVRELCNDWYEAEYYQVSPAVDPTGPEGSVGTHDKVVRGGGWQYIEDVSRCAARADWGVYSGGNRVGFRIARQAIN